MGKKLTLAELMEQKKKIKEKKNEKLTVYVKSLDAEIVVKKASADLFDEAFGFEGRHSSAYFVYNCVVEPDLKDKALQEAYECTEPVDIVWEIFEPGEVAQIGDIIMENSGLLPNKGTRLADTIKNS